LDSANSVSSGIGHTGPLRSKMRSTAAVAEQFEARAVAGFKKRR